MNITEFISEVSDVIFTLADSVTRHRDRIDNIHLGVNSDDVCCVFVSISYGNVGDGAIQEQYFISRSSNLDFEITSFPDITDAFLDMVKGVN